MYILAFETSCDDTSVAVLHDDRLLSMETRSQVHVHARTGGVVPEVAARMHEEAVFEALTAALTGAGVGLSDIDSITYTLEPGLLPSLLVGHTVARVLGYCLGRPLVPIQHIHAHIYANLLGRVREEIPLPAMCLTVSGGHNELIIWHADDTFETVGRTLDDAAGEALDKVAKMMGLGYPGGPVISRLAGEYAGGYRGIFPIVLMDRNSLDFSFSGLKTAVRREIEKRAREHGWDGTTATRHTYLTSEDIREIAYEMERATITTLVAKLRIALARYPDMRCAVLAGGVSANDRLRNEVSALGEELGMPVIVPTERVYSTDNAAMVGIMAYYMLKKK